MDDFRHVFGSRELRAQFDLFLKNVFMQLDETKFHALIDDILSKNLSYEDSYQMLFDRIGEAKKSIFSAFRALKVIKQVLVDQIGKLLCKGAKVNGYVELGYTGRLIRQMKSQEGIELSGKKIVVNEKERPTDYIEAGFPRPYHRFIPLNDYAPLALDKESVDLITCPIGLHHCPAEKLQPFIASIEQAIRPGGSFIIRDHDVKTRDMNALVNVVHSVFNAATGELLQTEMKEERNFKSLADWTKILADHGFEPVAGTHIQEGDPTDNTLVRFVKRGDEQEALERFMRMSHTGYERAQEQTYLTTLEWHLVATAKEYADFIKENPPSDFPYFKHIGVLWKAFINSCQNGIRVSSLMRVVSSEYMLMNLFMLFSTTGELLFRGLTATSQKKSAVTNTLAAISDEYAEFIKTVPFYNFPYFAKIKELCQAPKHSFKDVALTAMTILEFAAKGIVSAPIAHMYQGLEPGKIHLIINDSGRPKAMQVERYLKFKDLLCDFAKRDIQVLSIAGQKRVQVKVKIAKDARFADSVKILSEIPILTSNSHTYLRLDIAVNELTAQIKSLEELGGEISYVHDF